PCNCAALPAGDDATHDGAEQPANEDEVQVHCAHGRVLLQERCTDCDRAAKAPHPADPTSVYSRWAKTVVRRCRACGESPALYIHTKDGDR
ncbi:hypothetical protein, partial [Streptomyces chryseus]